MEQPTRNRARNRGAPAAPEARDRNRTAARSKGTVMTSRTAALAATLLAGAALLLAGGPADPAADRAEASAQDAVRVVAHAITYDPAAANTAVSATAAADTACTDSTYALKTWKVTGTYSWYYNATGAPAAVASTALGAITSASNTVAKGVNRCGLPATFTTVYQYSGATTAKPQIGADATCTGNDGKSVTGWGALPTRVLAYTCTYFSAKGVVLASDALIDNVAYTWFTAKPAACAGALYDLETTMAHERLHTAGLAHVDQTRNAAQTMTPASAPCDTSRRLLGAGDYAGLKALAGR